MSLKLTDYQAQILAACGLCSRPLEWRSVKTYLEGGGIPPDMYCRRCERAALSLTTSDTVLKAALRMLERIEAAGLTEHYKAVATDTAMRAENRQN